MTTEGLLFLVVVAVATLFNIFAVVHTNLKH